MIWTWDLARSHGLTRRQAAHACLVELAARIQEFFDGPSRFA